MKHNKSSAPRAARSCAQFWVVAILLAVALIAIVNLVEAYLLMWGWL